MKNSKTVLALAFCASILLGAGDAVSAIIDTQRTPEPGVWSSDFDAAMSYAEGNNIPMFVFWGNVGCTHCNAVEQEMNKEPFLSWMAERKILMVFVESNSKVKSWIKDNAKVKIKAYPYAGVYWPKNTNGEMVLEGFSAYKGNMGQYGASTKTSNTQQIMDSVDYLLAGWDPGNGGGAVDPVYYTVTFVVDSQKGTATGQLSQQVESGKGAVAPTVKAKDGWEFTGWDKSFSKVTANTTVTAKFSAVDPDPDPVYYTVNFVVDAEKGTATGELSQSVQSGKSAVAPVVTANEGWEFVGWDKSFSKVRSNLEVTAVFEQPADREEINPAVFFKKTKTISAIAYNGDALFGKATITLGKYNTKKKTLKATFKIASFAGKTYTKALTVSPDKYGDFLGLDVAFKNPIGTMAFDLVNDGGEYEVLGENDEYLVEAGDVEIGGEFENDEVIFSVDIEDFEPESDSYDFLVDLPSATATVKNGTSLSFGAAPKLKYNKYREDGETWYELAEYDEERYPNVNAVKITYKPTTGVFTGSFSVFATNEFSVDDGKKPTIKTYKGKVSGYVVNGEGVGTVSVKVGKKTYVGTCSLE